MATDRFHFAFDRRVRAPLSVLGIRPETCQVTVDDTTFAAHYGPWHVVTPLTNIAGTQLGGPFSLLRAVGPRMSLRDRGATFGTNTEAGVCIRFHDPVPGLLGRAVRHPGLTVTVTEPPALVASLLAHHAG